MLNPQIEKERRGWVLRALILCGACASLWSCLRFQDEPKWLTCIDDADCASGELCKVVPKNDVADQICIATLSCEQYSSCPAGYHCEDEVCLESECTTFDEDACGGYGCWDFKCLTECETDLSCSSGHVCVD